MFNAGMALKLAPLLKLENWRAASAFLKAMWAYQKGDDKSAIANFARAMRVEKVRTSENMAFYAVLMALNKRPAQEGLEMWTRVAKGEFRRDTDESRYAEALADYWVAFLTNRDDVEDRWRNALKLRPTKGFAARELSLPSNAVDPSGSFAAANLN